MPKIAKNNDQLIQKLESKVYAISRHDGRHTHETLSLCHGSNHILNLTVTHMAGCLAHVGQKVISGHLHHKQRS